MTTMVSHEAPQSLEPLSAPVDYLGHGDTLTGLGNLQASRYSSVANYYMRLAVTPEEGLRAYVDKAIFYGGSMDMQIPTELLANRLKPEERFEQFGRIARLFEMADSVDTLFPDAIGGNAREGFCNGVGAVLWSFLWVADDPSNSSVSAVLEGSKKKLEIRGVSRESALDRVDRFGFAMAQIMHANDPSQQVSRVNVNGPYGIYRRGKSQNVLTRVQLLPGTSFDPAIEYGSILRGTQAGVSHTVDIGTKTPTSVYKGEQVDPFCIRIDNEGNRLSLDVGSILGREGTIGKDIADLLAIGDRYRLLLANNLMPPGSRPVLNHFASTFRPEQATLKNFAQAASVLASELERRSSHELSPPLTA